MLVSSSYIVFFLSLLTFINIHITTTSAQNIDIPNLQNGNQNRNRDQQPILAPLPAPPIPTPTTFSTLTATTTTRYIVETYTAVRTRYVADGKTAVPSAVGRWYRERDLMREKGKLGEESGESGSVMGRFIAGVSLQPWAGAMLSSAPQIRKANEAESSLSLQVPSCRHSHQGHLEQEMDIACAASRPTQQYNSPVARDYARVHYGNNYVENQYITGGPESHSAGKTPPVDFKDALRFERMGSRFNSIDPAYANTCDWLFQTPEYGRWRNPEHTSFHHGFLWIKGKAGSGKSTLMKRALEHTKENFGDGLVVSFFFNARGGLLEKTVEGMYRSLLSQILDKSPSIRTCLPAHGPVKASEHGWPLPELRNHFSKATKELCQHQSVIFHIDALDECDEDDIRDAVELFEDLAQLAKPRGNLHICFASRHYPQISIRTCEEITIDRQREHEQDIFVFVKGKLKGQSLENKHRLSSQIYARCSHVFMWAVLVVQRLNKMSDKGALLSELEDALRVVPDKLEELIANITRSPDKALVAVLQWMLFPKWPLQLQELYFAVKTSVGRLHSPARDPRQADADSMAKFVLESSRGLIQIPEDVETTTPQLIHESVREYLLDGGLAYMKETAQHTVVAGSHVELADCCISYMMSIPLSKGWKFQTLENLSKLTHTETWEAARDLRDEYPLLAHVVENVFHYLELAWTTGKLDLGSLCKFPLGLYITLRNAIEQYKLQAYHRKPIVFLHIMILRGQRSLAKAILKMNLELLPLPNQSTGLIDITADASTVFRYRLDLNDPCASNTATLVEAAVVMDYADILKMLLDNGACVITSDQSFLGSAIRIRSTGVVQLLLRHGIDAKSLNDYRGQSHLETAILSYNPEMMKLLLDHGADPHNSGGLDYLFHVAASKHVGKEIMRLLLSFSKENDRLALSKFLRSASQASNAEGVAMLLEKGADPNARDSRSQTALHLAALATTYAFAQFEKEKHAELYLSTARTLLLAGADANAVGGAYGTALIAASWFGRAELVRLLLDHGAELHHRSKEYGTAFGAARMSGNANTVLLLEAALSKERSTT
ncbi:hypothetical protein Q7P37_005967 [Cladosporium fusiforme]